MKKKISLLALCLAVLSLAVSSQEPDIFGSGQRVSGMFGGLICGVVCLLVYVMSGIAAIILIFSGLKYLTSEDPEDRNDAKKRIAYAFIGLCFFFVALPVANTITAGMVAPFNCGCLPSTGYYNPPPPPAGVYRVIIIEPKDKSEYEMGTTIDFMGKAYGGLSPYSYNWTSSVDGFLDSSDSFSKVLTRAGHNITLEATDSAGKKASDMVEIFVIIPKPKP